MIAPCAKVFPTRRWWRGFTEPVRAVRASSRRTIKCKWPSPKPQILCSWFPRTPTAQFACVQRLKRKTDPTAPRGLERMVVACNRQRAALVQHSVVKPRSEVRSEAGKPHCSHRPRFQTLALDRRCQARLERIIFRCGNLIRCRPRKHQPRAHEEKRRFGKVFFFGVLVKIFPSLTPPPSNQPNCPTEKGTVFLVHFSTDERTAAWPNHNSSAAVRSRLRFPSHWLLVVCFLWHLPIPWPS